MIATCTLCNKYVATLTESLVAYGSNISRILIFRKWVVIVDRYLYILTGKVVDVSHLLWPALQVKVRPSSGLHRNHGVSS